MHRSVEKVWWCGLVAVLSVRSASAEQVAPPPGTEVDPATKAVTAVGRGYRNVALGRPYRLSPAPNYNYCTDPGDKTQLTDGKHVSGYFWVQTGTVGWRHTGVTRITVDLGKVEPIRGVSFNTAAGTAGVGWPTQVSVFVSEDGKTYYWIGDLIELSSARGLPEPMGYRTFTYWTDGLKTKGRYVQLVVVHGGAYAFCDEVEVWRGEDAWLGGPVGGKKVDDIKVYLRSAAATGCVRRRMRMDVGAIRKAIKASKMSADERAAAIGKLEEFDKQISAFTVDDPGALRAVMPLNELHRKILAVNAEVLRARGLKGLVLWQKNRWDPLGVLEAPESQPAEPPVLSVRMMRGEYRSVVLNATNASDASRHVGLVVRGLPGGSASKGAPDYVSLHAVQHVDTKQGVVVADALPQLNPSGGLYMLNVPAGTTYQLWISFHATQVKAGKYRGCVEVHPDSLSSIRRPVEIGVVLDVVDIDFPKHPALSLGMWDYTNHPPYHRDLTAENIKAAIADAKAHFHDAPWATSSVIPFPQKGQLDAEGNLKVDTLDFSRFDRWVGDWKDYARRYMVFANVPRSLAGRAMGTPAFDRLVGQWIVAWAEHCKGLGIKPKRVALLLRDEPHADEQHRHILAWAKAIKAATDFFCIWEDPVDKKLGTPDQNAMLEACDAICPNVGIYKRLGKKAEDFYGKLVADGKRELWFYQCTGPAKLLDPYAYHRLQAWHCWVHGAVGQGFWAYADAGGGNPWCEYFCRGTTYSPAYVAPDGITTSKHWEAVREGIEDYEYLHMLKRRVDELTKAGKTPPALERARRLLIDGPKRVAVYAPINWFGDRDRSLADKVRLEVLDALVSLSGR